MEMSETYSRLGWKVVLLHGVKGVGICSCHRGSECHTPGKHPVSNDWQSSATSSADLMDEWFASREHVNVGLLLGPASGVIDVELDGADSKAGWDSLELGEIWTPTYTAGRGPHRLFKWQDGLPAEQVRKVLGIEVRLGNGGRASQSVLPPSTHHTGVRYSWVDGLSPDDVELQPLPEKLLALLWNVTDESSPAKKPANTIIHEKVSTGDRNNELYRFAVRQGFRCLSIDDPKEQQDLLGMIISINQTRCDPPLPVSEVKLIYQSAVAYVRKNDAAGVPVSAAIDHCEKMIVEKKGSSSPIPRGERDWVKAFTATGLAFAEPRGGGDPEWFPGDWQLVVVHSDPLEYRLHVPAWKKHTASGSGNISLSVDSYRSATKVAANVLAATGVIMLDDEPGKWKRIWDGGGKKKTTRGIKAKLLDNVGHEYPGASSLRYTILAGWLYDRLSQAPEPSDDDTPDATGRAQWRADGTLWWNWTKVWEDIERNHRVMDGERLSLKRRLVSRTNEGGDGDSKDFRHSEFRHIGGSRKTYIVWTRHEFSLLEAMAASEEQ